MASVEAGLCFSKRNKMSRFVDIHQDSYIFIKNGIHISRFENKYQDSRMYTSSMVNGKW